MKTKLYAALVACVAIAGLLTANPRAAIAEPTCPGSGQPCALATDGTIYTKGNDQQSE
jgi:hypothetical protein